MEKTRPILYGVADYAQIRKKNAWFVDRTAKMIPAAYSDVHKIDERVYDINNGLCDFAEKGEWRGFIGILSGADRISRFRRA